MASVNEDCREYRKCLLEQVKKLPEVGTVPVGEIEKWLQGLEKKCDPNNTQPCIDDVIARLERMTTAELDKELAKLGSLKKRKKSKRKKKSKSSKKSKKSTKTKKSKTKSKKSKRVKRVKRSKTKRGKRGKRN